MPQPQCSRSHAPPRCTVSVLDRRKRIPTSADRPRTLKEHACLDARTYFLVVDCVTRLFERDRAACLPDVDSVIDIALRRAEAGRQSVSREDRYEAWVAVVCRNAYLNFIRSRKERRPLTDVDGMHDPAPSLDAAHDGPVIEAALRAAIDRLPRFLRDVARLRFLEKCGHRTISLRTGRTLPVTRAYANKAATRLRKDRSLLNIARDWTG